MPGDESLVTFSLDQADAEFVLHLVRCSTEDDIGVFEIPGGGA